MIIAALQELELYAVADRGIPNSERVPILVREHTNIGQFGLMVGYADATRSAHPMKDRLFWFGNGFVNPGDWIIVYTGGGTQKTEDWHTPPGSKVYTVHWGRDSTMFTNSSIVPILFKVSNVQVDLPPLDLPQLGQANS